MLFPPLFVAVGADGGERKIRGWLPHIVVAMAVDTDGIVAIDSLSQIPEMSSLAKNGKLRGMAISAGRHVRTEFGANETELCFVCRRVVVRVAAVAVVARHACAIVHAPGKISHRGRELAPGGEMAANAVGRFPRPRGRRLVL